MIAKQGAKGNVVGDDTRGEKGQARMALQVIVKECVFHPKRCEKICISLLPLPSLQNAHQGVDGGKPVKWQLKLLLIRG